MENFPCSLFKGRSSTLLVFQILVYAHSFFIKLMIVLHSIRFLSCNLCQVKRHNLQQIKLIFSMTKCLHQRQIIELIQVHCDEHIFVHFSLRKARRGFCVIFQHFHSLCLSRGFAHMAWLIYQFLSLRHFTIFHPAVVRVSGQLTTHATHSPTQSPCQSVRPSARLLRSLFFSNSKGIAIGFDLSPLERWSWKIIAKFDRRPEALHQQMMRNCQPRR